MTNILMMMLATMMMMMTLMTMWTWLMGLILWTPKAGKAGHETCFGGGEQQERQFFAFDLFDFAFVCLICLLLREGLKSWNSLSFGHPKP